MTGTRFGLSLLATLSLVVAACTGGSGASTAPSSAASAQPSAAASASAGGGGGELVIWADDKRAAALKPLAEKFGTDNGVTVKVEAISEKITDRFLTAHRGKTPPDIVVWAHDVIGRFVADGAIDPVQLADTSGFDPLAIKGMTFGGQLYGIPYSVENIGLFRNTDLVPDAPATMEDLVAAGQKLVDEGKTKEIMALQVGQKGDAYHIYPLWVSGGGSFFGTTSTGDPDPKNVTVDSEGSIAAGQKLHSLGEKGAKALKRSIDDKNAITLFAEGKAPFLVSGPWAISTIKTAKVNYDITPIPPFAGGAPAGPFVGVNGFYIASLGKNKTLAQEFATNFLTTLEVQLAMYKSEPRRPALLEAVDQVKADDPDIAKFLTASEGGVILPAIPEMGMVWEPFGIAEAAIVGGADPKSTLEAAAKNIRDKIGG